MLNLAGFFTPKTAEEVQLVATEGHPEEINILQHPFRRSGASLSTVQMRFHKPVEQRNQLGPLQANSDVTVVGLCHL